MEKKKKPIYKRWWAWVIAFIVVVAVAGGNGGGDQASKTTEATSAEPAAAEAKPSEPSKPAKITLADYETITTGDSLTGDGGMTYEEVVAKFGEPSSKTESQSGDMKMIIASWMKNINGGFGANFNITFINGKASAKSQTSME